MVRCQQPWHAWLKQEYASAAKLTPHRSPQVAAHFSREMDRLWRSADLGITERLRRKLERNRERCGSGIERG